MTFADPHICLSCQGPIAAGIGSCPHCGMDLASPEIQQAWRSLIVADQWIIRARMTNRAESAKAVETLPSGGPRVPRAPRRLSVGTVLLVIGAAALLVAGLIFITVSWGSMGAVGRALLLLVFTAIIGFLARRVTQRGLRASSEALWTVFLGSVTGEDSQLPKALRENIANLGIFVMKQTLNVMSEPEARKLTVLININREIAAGLRERA